MHTRGFTLVETVIAIGIIGIIVIATGTLLQRITVSGHEIRDQDIALRIARTQIEILRAGGYSALPATGTFTNTLLTSLASSTAQETITVVDAKTKKVDVLVSWRAEDANQRSLTLTTLMVQSSGLP